MHQNRSDSPTAQKATLPASGDGNSILLVAQAKHLDTTFLSHPVSDPKAKAADSAFKNGSRFWPLLTLSTATLH